MELDQLDKLAATAFDGYLVRKDLVRKYSRQYPVPTYVVEFLFGRYCATVDEDEIREGLQIVEQQLNNRTVRTGQEELFKSKARETGSVKLIDIVRARLDAKNDCYVAELPSLALKDVRIADSLVKEHERMLTDGFYAEVTHRDFDRAVFERLQESNWCPEVGPREWFCSAALCAYLQLPRDLAGAVKAVFGQTLDKGPRDRAKGKRPSEDYLLAGEITRYAGRDALACLALWNHLERHWPAHERRLFDLTSEMGRQGLAVAWDYVRAKRTELEDLAAAIADALPWKPATSLKQFAEACERIGVPAPPSTSNADPGFLRWLKKHIDSDAATWVRHMQRVRSANRTARVLEAMEARRMPSVRMAYELKYFGASTGRWSGGGGLNLQNLNRKTAEGVDLRQRTAERLHAMPGEGGTHRWLAQVASGLRHLLTADACFKFLRRCCDEAVAHRTVPDAEIAAAVDFAYSGQQVAKANFGRSPVDWPERNPGLIARVFAETAPAFDADVGTDLGPADVLPVLFRPGELVCSGRTKDRASIRPLEETIADAGWLQFIVVNPMRGKEAVNYEGKRSARCQNNTGIRRHLVAEFDDRTLSKAQQAQLIGRLAAFAPLVMVVDSGGQSLHAWFQVDQMPARDHVRFFYVACFLGADPSRWDICGWLRMPGGLRVVEGVPAVRQRILHFNPDLARA